MEDGGHVARVAQVEVGGGVAGAGGRVARLAAVDAAAAVGRRLLMLVGGRRPCVVQLVQVGLDVLVAVLVAVVAPNCNEHENASIISRASNVAEVGRAA